MTIASCRSWVIGAVVCALLLSGIAGGSSTYADEGDTGRASDLACLADLGGEVVTFSSPELRMEELKLKWEDHRILQFTGQDEYGVAETWNITVEEGEDGFVSLRLTAREGGVERKLEYLLYCYASQEDSEVDRPVTPVMATERAVDRESDELLYQAQSVDFTLVPEEGDRVRTDLRQALSWGLNNRDELVSSAVIDVISDYLWHNQGLDSPPGSYNGILKLLDRRIELDPMNNSQYCDAAWLWWSKWVRWKDNPEEMPDGEEGVEKALKLLKKGRAANPKDPEYYFEAAMTINPLARFHVSEQYDFVEAFLLRAEELVSEENDEMLVRVRKSIAHMYRLREMPERAIQWYRKVLEVDPENEVANRYLDRLLSEQKL
ncbi:MAG: tetratricopeptide repeat protein [Candidatus Brocadiia bacterium]